MNIFKSRLKLVKGTRLTSFLFIACSILIAAGILIAANMYYNIDTGEIVMEEIQRTTGLIRALGGVIVGGETLESGYSFQVVGSTLLATTTIAETGILRFEGAETGYYTGFRASPTATSGQSQIYTLPIDKPTSINYVLTSDTGGQLVWDTVAGVGAITTVGDVSALDSSAAFTSDIGEQYGTTLWFHRGSNLGALTVDTLSANATYTLPDLTGTIALQNPGSLGTGGVLFADSGLIATSTNFYWHNTDRYFRIGDTNNAGQLRISSGNVSGHYLGLRATSTMAGNTEYYWPADYGSDEEILASDGSGNLRWLSLGALGALSGSGAAGQVTYWTGASAISGTSTFIFNDANGVLTVGGGLVAPLLEYAGQLEIKTTAGGNILLNPDGNIVQLATSTYIRTHGGYEIGTAGTEILREMIPIMGFDLPVRTATSGTVQISRTIENYPVSSCVAGTSRIHKLVIRYGSMGTTTWAVATSGAAYTSFDVPQTNSTTTGTVHTAETEIPTPAGACTGWVQNSNTDDWWVRVSPGSNDTMIYQIFLAAYDVVQ